MHSSIETTVSAYRTFWHSQARECVCNGQDFLNIDIGEKWLGVCRAHAWLLKRDNAHDELAANGVCFAPPLLSMVGQMTERERGVWLSALRIAKVSQADLLGNPLHMKKPSIVIMKGRGKMAAQIAAALTRSIIDEKQHRAEHIVAFTSTTRLVDARMTRKQDVVNDVLLSAPALVVNNNFDGRTDREGVYELLYTRQYGVAIVIDGDW